MTTINLKKEDFIRYLSLKKGFSNLLSKKITDDLISALITCIQNGNLNLKNIGSFRVIKKKSRWGRNPKTKVNYLIKERKSLSFISSKKILKMINE